MAKSWSISFNRIVIIHEGEEDQIDFFVSCTTLVTFDTTTVNHPDSADLWRNRELKEAIVTY